MTNDKNYWCEFGCERKICYDRIKFDDGLSLIIPRESDNSIHNCPMLSDFNSDPTFCPEDEEIWHEQVDEQSGHFWDQNEVADHMMEYDIQLENCDGMEFKIYRNNCKKFLVKQLENIPHFYDEIRISGAEETLPACLQTEDPDSISWDNASHEDPTKFAIFSPVVLLGKFYEMDGSLKDAKKCFEIQMEISPVQKIHSDTIGFFGNSEHKGYWQNRIAKIDEQLRMEEESLIKKRNEEEAKRPQTNLEEKQTITEILQLLHFFERDDLRNYATDKITTREEMKKILKKILKYPLNCKYKSEDGKICGYKTRVKKEMQEHIEKHPLDDKEKDASCPTLYDKVKETQSYEQQDTIPTIDPIDQNDWDSLTLGDKIFILTLPVVGSNDSCVIEDRTIIGFLYNIKNIRNKFDHPKKFRKLDLVETVENLRLYCKKCKEFFKKSKGV